MAGEQTDQSSVADAILVVEDNSSVADFIADVLQVEGYVVDLASNGAKALDRLREYPYALILSDLRMPDMDGIGLYQTLDRCYPHLCQRMVFITGYPLTPEMQLFQDQTGTTILRKPFRVEDLLHLVRLLITSFDRPT
jgi:CheY-like chemotaxis protein